MFDSSHAINHCIFIARPRLVGTDQEKNALEYCVEVLKKKGIQAYLQPFSFSDRALFLLRLVPFVYGVAVLTIALFPANPSYIAFYVLLFLLLGVPMAGILEHSIGKLQFLGNTPLKSNNIIGHIPARQKESKHLVFMAHYDSKSQIVPVAFRVLCFIGLGLSTIVIVLNHCVSLYWDMVPFFKINSVCGYLAGVCGVILFFNITQNRSPGASDNAAGTAILLELSRVFCQDPLDTVSCTFVFTGAEEYGMIGASYFMANNTMTESTKFINIDGVGGNTCIGMVTPKKGKTLANKIRETAAGCSLPLKEIKTMPGVGFDHIPINAEGYEAVTLCSRSLGMLMRIHTKKDTIDRVMPQALQGIGALCEQYARELDGGDR